MVYRDDIAGQNFRYWQKVLGFHLSSFPLGAVVENFKMFFSGFFVYFLFVRFLKSLKFIANKLRGRGI